MCVINRHNVIDATFLFELVSISEFAGVYVQYLQVPIILS